MQVASAADNIKDETQIEDAKKMSGYAVKLALAEFSFDVTLIQACFRFLGKVHWTIKEALYRITLEENK